MFEMRSRYRMWVVAALALGLAALACSAPTASGQLTLPATTPTTTGEAPTELVTTEPPVANDGGMVATEGPSPVPQGPTATAGAPPAAQATTESNPPPSTPATGGGTADYENITFFFAYSISSKWEVKTVPSDPAGNGPDTWRVATHYEFTFPGYPVSNQYQPARIMIFPTSAWQDYNPEVVNRIPALKKLLTDKPASFGQNESIPVIPVFNAAQVFRAHVSYLSFQNGTGVRFVTQYDQAPIPINNKEMFYTFQGLTADGKYNVAAFFPITHPSLPADSSNAESVIGPDFLSYLTNTVQTLEAAKGSSFSPDLPTLDLMMQSLKVK